MQPMFMKKTVMSVITLGLLGALLLPGAVGAHKDRESKGNKFEKKIEKIIAKHERELAREDIETLRRLIEELRGRRRQPCVMAPNETVVAQNFVRQHGGEHPLVLVCRSEHVPRGILRRLLGLFPSAPTSTLDTTAPAISNIAVSSITSSTATVGWMTNESSTSKVYFGAASPLNLGGASSTMSSTLVMNHSLSLSGLNATTTYFYVVESQDASGNAATSSERSFATPTN